ALRQPLELEIAFLLRGLGRRQGAGVQLLDIVGDFVAPDNITAGGLVDNLVAGDKIAADAGAWGKRRTRRHGLLAADCSTKQADPNRRGRSIRQWCLDMA